MWSWVFYTDNLKDDANSDDSDDAKLQLHRLGWPMGQTSQKYKMPLGSEFSSNMNMYYAFDNHIYSFLPIITYVFLVWQTWFPLLIYANKLSNVTHMYLYKILMAMMC